MKGDRGNHPHVVITAPPATTLTAKSDPHYCDEVEIIFCGGGAKPTDRHLACRIVAFDDGIINWLQRRELNSDDEDE